MQPILGCTKDDGKKKPQLYKLYDFTKGGTDIIDQRMGKYSVKPKSNKWTVAAFSYILDTSRVNASTIWALNNEKQPKKVNSFNFGWELALSLVMPMIKKRDTSGLHENILNKIRVMLGKEYSSVQLPQPNHELQINFPDTGTHRRRCKCCMNEIKGKNDYKKLLEKINANVSQCQVCGNSVCKNHSLKMCNNCLPH